jgi:recombination protein RecT
MADEPTLDDMRAPPRGTLTARQAGSTVEAFFQKNKGALAPLLAGLITPDRMLKVAQNAIKQTPKLQECSLNSLFGAIMKCAAMGLEPNTHEGHCWLIPRATNRPVKVGNKTEWQRGFEVQVQIGYKGRIALAYRSPELKVLRTAIIHANDKYRIYEGTNPRIEHEPETRPGYDRGEPIIYYAIAKLATGETLFEFMTVADIDRIRDRYSESYRQAVANNKTADAPWVRDYDAMARKTVLNRISSWLPSNRQSALAQALDTQEMTGQHQDVDPFIDADFTSYDAPEEEPSQIPHEEKTPEAPLKPVVVEDVKVPPMEVHIKDSTGQTVGKIVNVAPTASISTLLPWYEQVPGFSVHARKALAKMTAFTSVDDALVVSTEKWLEVPVAEKTIDNIREVLDGIRASRGIKAPAEAASAEPERPSDIEEDVKVAEASVGIEAAPVRRTEEDDGYGAIGFPEMFPGLSSV